MRANKSRGVLASSGITIRLIIAATGCGAVKTTAIDAAVECLDDAGVSYTIEDGAIVVTTYATDDVPYPREDIQACMELVPSH